MLQSLEHYNSQIILSIFILISLEIVGSIIYSILISKFRKIRIIGTEILSKSFSKLFVIYIKYSIILMSLNI